MSGNHEQRVLRFLRYMEHCEMTGGVIADNTSLRWWQKPGRSRTYAILARLQRDGIVEARWGSDGKRYFRLKPPRPSAIGAEGE